MIEALVAFVELLAHLIVGLVHLLVELAMLAITGLGTLLDACFSNRNRSDEIPPDA